MSTCTVRASAQAKSDDEATRALLDLEEPIRDLMHMASIAGELADTALDGEAGKREGDQVVITMREHEHERLLFAIGKVSEMAGDLDAAFQAKFTG